jgi:hypothetical protein
LPDPHVCLREAFRAAAPHCDAADRSELLAQELGKTIAGYHRRFLVVAPAG